MQLKTTLYDIIGYILPGLLLVALIGLGWANYNHNLNSLHGLLNMAHSLKWIEVVLILGVSYIIGHVVSSISSLVIEKWFCKGHDNNSLVDDELFKSYKKKFENLYNLKPNSNTFRLSVCHVESKHPQVYSTAFVFQSFYGMARNISFLLLLFGLWELFLLAQSVLSKSWQSTVLSLLWALGAFLLGALMFYIYKRFIKYYRTHIMCGFLLGDD